MERGRGGDEKDGERKAGAKVGGGGGGRERERERV